MTAFSKQNSFILLEKKKKLKSGRKGVKNEYENMHTYSHHINFPIIKFRLNL